MLQKLFLGGIVGLVVVGGVYAYQQRLEVSSMEQKIQEVARAHDAFFPSEWSFHQPLLGYERDSIGDILRSYERDSALKQIRFVEYFYPSGRKSTIDEAHYDSFVPLDQLWARDENSLFYHGKRVLSAITSPQLLPGGAYLRDNKKIYFWDEDQGLQQVTGADSASFQALQASESFVESFFASDDARVYKDGKVLQDIKPQGFQILSDQYVKDESAVYYIDNNCQTHRLTSHMQSFEIIQGQDAYDAQDKNTYFWHGEKVKVLHFD